MKYIDAHSHWADPRFAEDPTQMARLLKSCVDKYIDFFLQGGVNPEDWQRQIALKTKYPAHIGLCFGLHPYFVAASEAEVCEAALDQLTHLLDQSMALGEAGLDFRPHIMKDSELLQIEMFENQIELAKVFRKPMVLHIVQAHEKAAQIFDIWGAPESAGFLHAFNSSFETAKKFINKGFLISVGGAVTFDKNSKLRDCIKKLPMEYLLIESDSPDQTPKGWSGLNDSSSLFKVAESIGLIKNLSAFEVLEISSSNFKRLFSL
jgi:TatD DNase family protein